MINTQSPHHWFNDRCWEYINTFWSLPQTYVYIRNYSHKINQCEFVFENANYDAGHTYGINWKWNNWYHFHFCFNYHLLFSQLKTHSTGITDYQLSPRPIICTSFNGLSHHIIKMAINYIEIILCVSKLHVFNLVLIFCPDSTDVAKYNYVMMNIW